MGGSHSREGLDLSDSDYEDEYKSQSDSEDNYQDAQDDHHRKSSSVPIDDIDAKLKALKLKYSQTPSNPNSVKLYLHTQGKWIISDKLITYKFIKLENDDVTGDVSDDEDDDSTGYWYLKVGNKVRARVSTDMQVKMFAEQRRVDFVDNGVWAMRFFKPEDYRGFIENFQSCLFENVYGLKASDENKVKVYGKDFLGWAKPEIADDTMWENEEEDGEWRNVENSSLKSFRTRNDLLEEFEEVAGGGGGIRSVALGALDNSFLVNDTGVQVVKNFSHGIHGKGVYVKFDNGGKNVGSGTSEGYLNAQKALLMRGETNMLLMSPLKEGKPHSSGVNQLDIETGKIVTEWKFEKDGTEISMRDITNDTKGSQLDPSESTFLGLDDNRLSQWDMRDRRGMVQSNSPVLEWTKGHQFSRGTNFQCFATTGDGSIVVGSLDGKIRLYSTTSMRQAKTAFPGLGSPITHVDVTYDGKWILGTTDTYLILICTLFTDKDGKTKTGFSGRMGSKIPAPRLLKLTPVDSHTAGKQNKFHGGRFSWVTESGKQERHLVATVGKFSVIWDFQQVKNSAHECYRNQQGLKSCYCYKLMTKDESIIESRFMHDKYAVSDSPEAPLVVATPQKVTSFSMSDGKGKRRI